MAQPAPPRVSVIIPAYNQAKFVGQAVRSVLEQTVTDWELIVVDDGSTDQTIEALSAYSDPRIRIVRQENGGLPEARNTGIGLSRGEYLTFLDADDAFLPHKLELHLKHFARRPGLGLSYASRIEVDSAGRPVWLLRAPEKVSLEHLLLGFPFTINDLMVRREWVEKAGPFCDEFRLHSEDRDFYLRLALAGCRFEAVNGYVSYRRIHARRTFDSIPQRIDAMHRALNTAFEDPRCPAACLALREQAYAKVYLPWVCQEWVQGELAMGQTHLRTALRLYPSLAADGAGRPHAGFLKFLIWYAVRDEGDHTDSLDRLFAGLPGEMAGLREALPKAIGLGHLLRGSRDLLWGREAEAAEHFAAAGRFSNPIDDWLLDSLSDQLCSYGQLYGRRAALKRLENLMQRLKPFAPRRRLSRFAARVLLSGAFQDYRQGRYRSVPAQVAWAARRDLTVLKERGALSILLRSWFKKSTRPAESEADEMVIGLLGAGVGRP